jgi:hypothetical protein
MSGGLSFDVGGSRITDPAILEPMVRGLSDKALAVLGRVGLLDVER